MFTFKMKYRLCELFGIPILIDFSFLVLLFLFVSSQGSLARGLAFALVLALSVLLHELGHSLTARAFGYETRDITISLLGGCASLIALPREPRQELLTALAGPAVSFALAVGSLAGLSLLGEGSAVSLVWHLLAGSVAYAEYGARVVFLNPDQMLNGYEIYYSCPKALYWLVDALIDIGCLNAMLGAFNLLPGFPMDGGRIFRSVMRAFVSKPRATFVAMWVGRIFAILLGLGGLNAIVHGGSWGFVRILIAVMIWQEGWREYQLALMESSWREWSQGDFKARVSPPPYEED